MNNEISRPLLRRRRSPRPRAAAPVAGCLLAALALPAAAQPIDPPGWWLAESPGTSGARFGLGVDFRWEDLDGLSNTAFTTFEFGPDGSPRVIPGDPELNERKFDGGVEVRSWGLQAPIALRPLRLGGGATLYPSLVLEVAITETTFDFHDLDESETSTSVSGRGVSWGAGLEGVAALGPGGRWFLAGGYRFQSLPDVDLERSPAIYPAVGVFEDPVSLGRETHLGSLRLGRVFAGGRLAPWIGARGRRTELEMDNRVRLDFDGQEVSDFATASRFEGDSTLTVAGVDGRLGGQMVGRAEVAFGDGDTAVLLKAVYLVPSPGGRHASAPDVTPDSRARSDARAEGIARRFESIEREFTRAVEALGPPSAPGYVAAALQLLGRTEREAVRILEGEGYHGLADWVRDRAEDARTGLEQGAAATRPGLLSAPVPGVRLASLAPPPQDPAPPDAGGWLDGFARALRLIFVRAEERCLEIELGFTIEGVDRASVLVHLRGVPPNRGTLVRANGDPQAIRIGSYSYQIRVQEPREETSTCKALAGGPLLQCPLDLVTNPVRIVDCDGVADNRECVYGARHRCAAP